LSTDNTGARDLSYNPEHHERVKHVERRHFFIRECVEQNLLVVPHVDTKNNLADLFTKPLDGITFFRLRNLVLNWPNSRANRTRARALAAASTHSIHCADCASTHLADDRLTVPMGAPVGARGGVVDQGHSGVPPADVTPETSAVESVSRH
jgi:hypothetical protein